MSLTFGNTNTSTPQTALTSKINSASGASSPLQPIKSSYTPPSWSTTLQNTLATAPQSTPNAVAGYNGSNMLPYSQNMSSLPAGFNTTPAKPLPTGGMTALNTTSTTKPATQPSQPTQNLGFGNNGTVQSNVAGTNQQQSYTNAQSAGQPANANSFGGIVNNLANTSQTGNTGLALNAEQIANSAGNAISNVGQSGARGEAGYLTTGTSPVGEGNAAVLAQTTAAQQQAIAQGANMQLSGNAQGLTAQSQEQSGLSSAGQLASPRSAGSGYVQIDPTTGQPIGGAGTAGSAATLGATIDANATSASGLQQNINNIQSQSGAFNSNFNVLNSLAAQGGTNPSVPILTALQQLGGGTIGGPDSQAVAAFKSQLQSIQDQYRTLTGDSSFTIPQNVTADQLQSIQQTMQTNIANTLSGYQNKLSQLQGGSQASSNDPLGIR